MNTSSAAYAELHCISNFTFLRGASHPEELVIEAALQGYSALAITDECSLAGVVRAHVAAKSHPIKLIIGSEFHLADGPRIVLLAQNLQGYGDLAQLITAARRRSSKGNYHITQQDLNNAKLSDCLALWLPEEQVQLEHGHWLRNLFPQRAWIVVELHRGHRDDDRLEWFQRLAHASQLPLTAAGGVHMHVRTRRYVQDTLTAIRLGTTVQNAGFSLHANGERYLRSRALLTRIYPMPLIAETQRIAEHCEFSLTQLRYDYPQEIVPQGKSPTLYLRDLAEDGMRKRWPDGAPLHVRQQIDYELTLIAEMGYEPYFLTVHDIVRFARQQNILCQGRGSAANSAVCFCLGITEVDPARMSMLFERFISKERNEPPDIDVDFEHERREEVIQYIYQKYGRDRAALAATVTTYQPRSAFRDVGKALGLDLQQVDRLAKNMSWWDGGKILEDRVREAGFDPANPTLRRVIKIVDELINFPRHLSQHVGGFVISNTPLHRLVPIENAAMAERTVIQWDKDDLDALGLLKVDCLALGMLTAIHRAFDYIACFRQQHWTMASVPAEDPAVYEMLQRADSVGVFQVESRAQMAMLPRLKPTCFYDLVIEVAIVRPGPIQGDMVHPYLRRRQGKEAVSYPSKELEAVLSRTLGVPIFQEQVMKVAMVAAGFSAGEADQLRRAMAAWRRKGGLEHFEKRLIEGMSQRGYTESFAQQIYQQILGFGEYGFPESHSASFSLLVYVSAWLKCHEPAAFTCALLNSLPMGFYGPSQLVQDARRHGVTVRPVDVTASEWDCTLERDELNAPALRLGLRLVKGLARHAADTLIQARQQFAFESIDDLWQRTGIDKKNRDALAAADALSTLVGHRRLAHWHSLSHDTETTVLNLATKESALPVLDPPTEGENIIADYHAIGLSLNRHPLALLRTKLALEGVYNAAQLSAIEHGSVVKIAGLVTCRQRPSSTSGVTFVTLEDETGFSNVVVWQRLAETQRKVLLKSRLLVVNGKIERDGEVVHVIAARMFNYSHLLGELSVASRDFH